MKHTLLTLTMAIAFFMLHGAVAQTTTPPVQHGVHFVDVNGDGINDHAPDADKDGIPNGQDPDYVKAGLGQGAGFVDVNGDGINDHAPDADKDGIPNGQDADYTGGQQARGRGARMHAFIDEDGDGINDRLMDADKDGVPNCQDGDWVRPMDGTGNKFGRGLKIGKGFSQTLSATGAGVAGSGTGKSGKRFGRGK